MDAKTRRKITQTTGARVTATTTKGVTLVGVVVGHYDDDSVYVLWGDAPVVDRVPTEELSLIPATDEHGEEVPC